MDSTFLSSVFSIPPIVLGRQLKPFCCGHAVVLTGLNSPYLIGGKISANELFIAVFICSKSYEEIKKLLTSGEEVYLESYRQWIREELDFFSLADSDAIFQEYLIEHLKAPDRWQKKDAKHSKAPWPLTIATGLMRELKFSEDEAWNMPMQQAFWYFAAVAEAEGDDSLVSEKEKKLLAIARENKRRSEVING